MNGNRQSDDKKSITKTRNLKSTKCLEHIFVVSSFGSFVMKKNILLIAQSQPDT